MRLVLLQHLLTTNTYGQLHTINQNQTHLTITTSTVGNIVAVAVAVLCYNNQY